MVYHLKNIQDSFKKNNDLTFILAIGFGLIICCAVGVILAL